MHIYMIIISPLLPPTPILSQVLQRLRQWACGRGDCLPWISPHRTPAPTPARRSLAGGRGAVCAATRAGRASAAPGRARPPLVRPVPGQRQPASVHTSALPVESARGAPRRRRLTRPRWSCVHV